MLAKCGLNCAEFAVILRLFRYTNSPYITVSKLVSMKNRQVVRILLFFFCQCSVLMWVNVINLGKVKPMLMQPAISSYAYVICEVVAEVVDFYG